MPAPTPEQRAEVERAIAVEGALMCLTARDNVEKMSDRELVDLVEKHIWGNLRFGSAEDWLLDELINRFETRRGIARDDNGNILPP
jgi:hypothetical protein